LHRKKEVRYILFYRIVRGFTLRVKISRAKTIKAEFVRKAEMQAHEGRKAADILADGVIVGVGLISREQGDK
jgi:hypothetical protein